MRYRPLRRWETGYATHLNPSIWRSHASSWFQLVKFRLLIKFLRIGIPMGSESPQDLTP
jgi:hypothetical protein